MRKVLIADDDKLSRKLLQMTLEKAGYEVVAVEEGAAAGRILCEPGAPRLALLDWMMPGLDGPAVIRVVRSQEGMPYVHMILLTSRQSKDDLIAGLEAGADDYLTKPFHPEELRARLHTGERILQLEDKLVEAREEMRFKATHDPLTSLWNRSMIMDILKREVTRAGREREPRSVAVAIGDIDHFKKVNDTYGHAAGDEVLREVASRLTRSVRGYDAVARYGGEEFAILLSQTNAHHAQGVAEKLRRLVETWQFPGVPRPVTISAGISTFPEHGTTRDELVKAADAGLYAAKQSGRNRVVLAPMALKAASPA